MGCQWLIFLTALLLLATADASHATNGVAMVYNISELEQSDYGVPGISHITVAGAFRHGFKEVEVWLQTLAPGVATPAHRHDCEEVVVVLKGSATLYVASNSHQDYPGSPQALKLFPNSTFHIPANAVHQVVNTNTHEDLHALAAISRPPMKTFIYDDWFTPHTDAKLIFPIFWDAGSFQKSAVKEEL